MNDLASVAARLGLPVSELVRFDDSPAGLVIVTAAGTSYIDVPADRPDGDGKHGVMYLAAPSPTYRGTFPIYTPPGPGPDGEVERDAGGIATGVDDGLDGLSKDELVDVARDLGLDVSKRWSAVRLVEAIRAARAAAGGDGS